MAFWIPILILGSLGITMLGPQIATYFAGKSSADVLSQAFNSFPLWFWALLIFFLFIILLRRGKGK